MGFFKKKKNILPPAEDHIEANLANSTVYVRDLQKIYPSAKGDVQAMKDVNINVMENEFVSIVGPSGCGKSTLLRMIGGLDTATSGKIVIQDRDIIGPGADRGMVFQSYTLFPWMTVGDNIKFGLKLRKMPADQQEEILNKYLKIIKLEKFRDSYPRELSGGMKQRVAIARALANSPEVLRPADQSGHAAFNAPDLAGGKADCYFCHTRYRGGSLFIQQNLCADTETGNRKGRGSGIAAV